MSVRANTPWPQAQQPEALGGPAEAPICARPLRTSLPALTRMPAPCTIKFIKTTSGYHFNFEQIFVFAKKNLKKSSDILPLSQFPCQLLNKKLFNWVLWNIQFFNWVMVNCSTLPTLHVSLTKIQPLKIQPFENPAIRKDRDDVN